MNENARNPAEDLKSLTWIESTGGPLLLLEKSLLPYWHGSFGKSSTLTDYDRACKIADYVETIEVGSRFGVVLGEEPLSTTWWPSGDLLSSFLVRWVFAEDEAPVREALRSLPIDIHWQPTNVRLEILDGELILFDSSCLGTAIDMYLTIEILPGRYNLETLHYNPNDELSLILHRFVSEPNT